MKCLSVLILLVLLNPASSVCQSVINSTGTSVQGSSVNFEYSIGEIAITTLSSTNNKITQGLLQPLIVFKDCNFLQFIPSAFTPNNDSKNDCFGISSWPATTSFSLSIYNRWGQMIFSTTKSDDCWNGEFNGQLQATGVYVYIIKATLVTCGSVMKKGTVLLIR